MLKGKVKYGVWINDKNVIYAEILAVAGEKSQKLKKSRTSTSLKGPCETNGMKRCEMVAYYFLSKHQHVKI
jgi:hypothetical protein